MISQPDSSNFSKNSAELSIIIKRTETPPSPLCVFLYLAAGHIESHQVGLAGLVSLPGGHIDGAYRAADIQLRLIGLVIEVLSDDHTGGVDVRGAGRCGCDLGVLVDGDGLLDVQRAVEGHVVLQRNGLAFLERLNGATRLGE